MVVLVLVLVLVVVMCVCMFVWCVWGRCYLRGQYSYAILAWQILAGERPYSNLYTNSSSDKSGQRRHLSLQQIKQMVVLQGLRPQLPAAVVAPMLVAVDRSWPEGMPELLQKCWCHAPGDRPGFSFLVLRLQAMSPVFEALPDGNLADADY